MYADDNSFIKYINRSLLNTSSYIVYSKVLLLITFYYGLFIKYVLFTIVFFIIIKNHLKRSYLCKSQVSHKFPSLSRIETRVNMDNICWSYDVGPWRHIRGGLLEVQTCVCFVIMFRARQVCRGNIARTRPTFYVSMMYYRMGVRWLLGHWTWDREQS